MPISVVRAGRSPATRPRKSRRPGRPVGSDGAEMRRVLLQAALGAFARHGYDAMSVRDLAREMDVSHNLVRHYYGSKEELWRAALEHGFASSARELVTLIESSTRSADWETAVRESVKGAITLLARYPEVTTILVQESARGGERLDFLFDHYMKPFADLLAGLLGERKTRPASQIDPRAALLFLFSGMTALFAHGGLVAKLGGFVPVSERELARYADSIAELITHGLKVPARPSPVRRRRR
jgi:TetR/AcrR family transcriptional regulator